METKNTIQAALLLIAGFAAYHFLMPKPSQPLVDTSKLEKQVKMMQLRLDSINGRVGELVKESEEISAKITTTIRNIDDLKRKKYESIININNLSDSASFEFFSSWISQDASN